MRVTATAARDGARWVVDITGVEPGLTLRTQTTSVDEIPAWVRDAVVTGTDLAAEDVHVEFEVAPDSAAG